MLRLEDQLMILSPPRPRETAFSPNFLPDDDIAMNNFDAVSRFAKCCQREDFPFFQQRLLLWLLLGRKKNLLDSCRNFLRLKSWHLPRLFRKLFRWERRASLSSDASKASLQAVILTTLQAWYNGTSFANVTVVLARRTLEWVNEKNSKTWLVAASGLVHSGGGNDAAILLSLTFLSIELQCICG